MKKVILSAAAVLLIVTAGLAQVSFGVKAGINLANQKFKSSGSTETGDAKIGFAGGGFAEIGVSENFAVQAELLYSQMGAKQKDPSSGATFSSNLDYIAIPVLAKYKNSGFGVYLGPQIGILASAKYKGNGESVNAKDSYKGIDFSGVAGVEYTFEPGIVISARYLLGLANIAKNTNSGDKLTNSAFNFTVGYKFGSSGKK